MKVMEITAIAAHKTISPSNWMSSFAHSPVVINLSLFSGTDLNLDFSLSAFTSV